MTLRESIFQGQPAPGSLGILGGTFNPIHTAHLIIAEEARIRLGLEQVQFIPNRIPPHKQEETGLASEEDRYLMAALATADNPSFFVSRIELDREGPSYTYDTLKALRDRIPAQVKLFFILGLDSIIRYEWHRFSDMMDLLTGLVAFTRPGQETGAFLDRMRELYPDYEEKTHVIKLWMDLSGTEIRKRVQDGVSIRYLVPGSVESYILKRQLYKGG